MLTNQSSEKVNQNSKFRFLIISPCTRKIPNSIENYLSKKKNIYFYYYYFSIGLFKLFAAHFTTFSPINKIKTILEQLTQKTVEKKKKKKKTSSV